MSGRNSPESIAALTGATAISRQQPVFPKRFGQFGIELRPFEKGLDHRSSRTTKRFRECQDLLPNAPDMIVARRKADARTDSEDKRVFVVDE
jgi:hypothetical protein